MNFPALRRLACERTDAAGCSSAFNPISVRERAWQVALIRQGIEQITPPEGSFQIFRAKEIDTSCLDFVASAKKKILANQNATIKTYLTPKTVAKKQQ